MSGLAVHVRIGAKPMTTEFPFKAAVRQRGIAALEFALILPLMLVLLAFPLLFGRAFFHYAAAQQAARDAALYLSTVPRIALSTPARTSSELAVASSIATMELAELNPGPYAPSVSFYCDGSTCDGFSIPASIRVRVRVDLFDDIFHSFTSVATGDAGLLLTADMTMRYVGI